MKTRNIFERCFLKRSILNFFILILFFSACQTSEPKLTIEGRVVADKTEDWLVDAQYPVFSSPDAAVTASLDNLNREIESYVLALADSLKADAEEMFNSFETDSLPRPVWTYALNVTDSVYMATDKYVSVRMTVYEFTGGAHGMTNFVAFNYDVENQKLLSKEDLLNYGQTVTINSVLKKNFENPEQCFDIDPTIDLVSSINFSASSVCFTFGHYSLGPYACGPAEVIVPLDDLGETFLPAFAD